MSREHAQLKLRLPPELRDKIVASSEQEGRSINAELVHRLELSFGPSVLDTDELPSPDAARKQSLLARDRLSQVVKTVASRKIREAIQQGSIEAFVDLKDDLNLDVMAMDEELLKVICQPALQELEAKGYKTHSSDICSFEVHW